MTQLGTSQPDPDRPQRDTTPPPRPPGERAEPPAPTRRILPEESRRLVAQPAHWAGLGKFDLAVLTAYLARPALEILELHTNVRLPLVDEFARPITNPLADRLARALFPRRIDAIIHRPGVWEIIEIKPRANIVAIGQILFYTHHARQAFNGLSTARPVILAAHTDPDIEPVLNALGIELRLVPESNIPPPS